MQRTVENVFFALIRFEINGTELCDDVKNLITPEILSALFKLSKKHDLAHLIGDALDKNSLLPDNSETKKRFLQERNMAVYRYEQIQYEFEQICNTLDTGKVPFVPLKGSVIRQYYPEPWMRTSCDIDILVKENDLDKAIELLIDKLQYKSTKERTAHEVSLFSNCGVHLELHFTIKENVEKMDSLLGKVWEYSHRKEAEGYCYLQSNEFFFFHMIAHMAFHFITGGCGVRTFLDVWLLRSKSFYDENIVVEMCKQTALKKFYDAMNQVISAWFCGSQKTEVVLQIEEYLLEAGIYGSLHNRVAVQQINDGGKGAYILKRIFCPYKLMKNRYPILERHKWLLPFYEIKRWFSILRGRGVNKAMKEIRVNSRIDDGTQKELESLLKCIGLFDN